jgi:hypothetical protein
MAYGINGHSKALAISISDMLDLMTPPLIQTTLQRRAKIIDMCEYMQDDLMKRVDPILHAKFAAEGIEGQLWGM